jgi:hypothetical protein
MLGQYQQNYWAVRYQFLFGNLLTSKLSWNPICSGCERFFSPVFMNDTPIARHIAHETAICCSQKIRQTEIRASADSRLTNTPSVKILCPQHICLSLYLLTYLLHAAESFLRS